MTVTTLTPVSQEQTEGQSRARVHSHATAMVRVPVLARLALLLLVLVAFGRVMWALDAKDLWWDESLSLQRAEQSLPNLLLGILDMPDGFTTLRTYDQHPFFFFLVQGLLLRLAGSHEIELRFPSVLAATLLVPLVWTWARWLVRHNIFAPGAPLWSALLAAAHPYYLWYGQEARPYALWATLALWSTYCLVRATEAGNTREVARRWWLGYVLTAAAFYTTHYYAVFLLPVQALIVAQWLWTRRRWLAWTILGGALLAGIGVGLYVYWAIVLRQGGGGNFNEVDWRILLPDLLNAFSLGLSVDITQIWWLDIIFGIVALLGAVMALRHWRVGGWLPAALVLGPLGVLLVANLVYPAYMSARHMSLIGGGAILLLGGGLAAVAQWRRWTLGVAALLALLFLVGMVYSTRNYFTLEEYAKDDFSGLASYMDRRLAPGDVLLYRNPFSWRIFDYYLPLEAMDAAREQGAMMAYYGMPLLYQSRLAREAAMQQWAKDYRRVWLVWSNTHPYLDVTNHTARWLNENLFRVSELIFFSHSSLGASLYLEEVPVVEGLPPELDPPLDVVFGNQIMLVGLGVGEPAHDELGLPVDLYWQTTQPTPNRYKYILALEELLPDGTTRTLALTEREPYEGAIPTIYWQPNQTIVEYSELPPPVASTAWPRPQNAADAARYRLALQVYQADTLAKLPVTRAAGVNGDFAVGDDGVTVYFPYGWPDWSFVQPGR